MKTKRKSSLFVVVHEFQKNRKKTSKHACLIFITNINRRNKLFYCTVVIKKNSSLLSRKK